MAKVTALTETKLADLWREVKDQDADDFWGDLKEETLGIAKALIETHLEAEMVERLGANRYKRNPDRCGWRNGHYKRDVLIEMGLISDLRVPRARKAEGQSHLLEAYKKEQGRLKQLVRGVFLGGVSTRQVGQVLEPVLGKAISASSVSAITSALDREVAAFLSSRIADEFDYLLLDGITLKVKTAQGVQKKLVLTAYGITGEGKRRIISFRIANSESEAEWEAFLNDLYRRGLEGNALKLVVTDGCPGLHKALDTVYPYVDRQLCWVHKMRNLTKRVPKAIQQECLAGAKKIYLADNRREAIRAFKNWAGQWRGQVPEAVACIERDLEQLLAFMSCPKEDWRKVRTTNAIERSFREVRRRIRPMSCFNNNASCRRIFYGVFSHLNKRWEDRLILHN
ncbi:MAG: IS256 family transposase [Dehalococcoidales bacterium]|nr:IS256 family transposase [Dehalococcoidales bacterium]